MPNSKINQDDPVRLKTLIHGTDGTNNLPLRTDSTGSIVTVNTKQFVSLEESYITLGTFSDSYSNSHDVSSYAIYTYFVTSQGGTTLFTIQISPDNITFVDDGLPVSVPSGQATVLVSNNFLRYIRLRITDTGAATSGKIFLQAQG